MASSSCVSVGLDGKSLLQCKRWKTGPSFLWGPDSEWLLQTNSHQDNDNDPVLKKVVCSSTRKEENEVLNRILSHFPNWFRLQRFVAWMRWTVKGLQRSLSKMVGSDSRTTSWVLFTSFLHSCEDASWGSREWVDVSKLFSIVTFFGSYHPCRYPFHQHQGGLLFTNFGETGPVLRWGTREFCLRAWYPELDVINDIVLIMDKGAPRGSWLLGRIIKTYPDKNGYVRNVAMKTRALYY